MKRAARSVLHVSRVPLAESQWPLVCTGKDALACGQWHPKPDPPRILEMRRLVAAVLLVFAAAPWLSATEVSEAYRVGTFDVTILNKDDDEFLKTLKSYDKNVTWRRVRDYAAQRWREMFAKVGLAAPEGEGSTLTAEMRLSEGFWSSVAGSEKGDEPERIVSKGVIIETDLKLRAADGSEPIVAKLDAGSEKVTPSQWRAIQTSVDLHVVLSLAQWAERGHATDRIVPMLTDYLPREGRLSVWVVLEQIAKAQGAKALLPLLGHEAFWVREGTMRLLGRMRDPKAVEPVLALLTDKDADVREAAAETLAKLADAKAVDPLIARLMKDESSAVRKAAATALGDLAARPAVDALIASLSDKDAEVRSACAIALRKITKQDLGENAERWRDWQKSAGTTKKK